MNLILEYLAPSDELDQNSDGSAIRKYWITSRNNKCDLAACSLVSYTWRQLTLPYLFRDFVFHITSNTSDISDISCRSDTTLRRNIATVTDKRSFDIQLLPMLLSFLQSVPQLCVQIQQLSLVNHAFRVQGQDPNVFHAIISCLPRLRTLHLFNVVFRFSFPTLAPSPILPVPLGIDKLILCYNSPACDLTPVLSRFGRVKELQLAGVLHANNGRGGATDLKDLEIENLVIQDFTNSISYLDLLLSTPTVHSLKSLRIDPVTPTAIHHVHDFLLQVSPSLMHLHYNICYMQTRCIPAGAFVSFIVVLQRSTKCFFNRKVSRFVQHTFLAQLRNPHTHIYDAPIGLTLRRLLWLDVCCVYHQQSPPVSSPAISDTSNDHAYTE